MPKNPEKSRSGKGWDGNFPHPTSPAHERYLASLRKAKIRTCQHRGCGAEFEPKDGRQFFCTPECRNRENVKRYRDRVKKDPVKYAINKARREGWLIKRDADERAFKPLKDDSREAQLKALELLVVEDESEEG